MADEDNIPLNQLVKVYRKIRARIEHMTKEHEAAVAVLEEQKDEVASELRQRMLSSGVSSLRTDEGTVVLATKTRYYTQDWDSFKKFVVEHDALDLYEKRIHQTNMKVFMEENPGAIPPGLNADREYVVSVRKPTK